MKKGFHLLLILLLANRASAQEPGYPYPVNLFPLQIEEQAVQMAYMDIHPSQSNGETVLLLHGKNFNGYYWKMVIDSLVTKGYRVVVPDQVGWGKSGKPNIHYSFHLLAGNTKQLLDRLGLQKIHLLGHSMGGMLAARFALMYPLSVDKLILENPIGLEDYKTFVPYRTTDSVFVTEMKATYESLKKYQQTYYPEWKPEYEQYVMSQWTALQSPSFRQAAWAGALTYQVIYEQPVLYEFKNISATTLLIIGQADRTVVGKNLLSKDAAAKHGNYPALGKWLQGEIKGSKLVELPGVGHIPHIQVPGEFLKRVISFLKG